jgi:integrase
MLSDDLARYTDEKRSLGFKYQGQNGILRSFVRFAEDRRDRYIRNARVLAWAAQARSPEHRRARLLTVRRFALALRAENARHQVPAADALGQASSKRRPPYIYTPDEIGQLLGAAAALPPADSIRPIMYATLLGLIAATGVRIAEALALQLDDVTADGLVIQESKFRKTRLLPLHATTRKALDRYLVARQEVSMANRALFISVTGNSLPCRTVYGVFLQLLDRTGLRGANAGRNPRIHDLRHTFAVRSLEQCRLDRMAVTRHIVALSTYLGHVHVRHSYWYMQATPVLMGQIADAGEALLMGGAA